MTAIKNKQARKAFVELIESLNLNADAAAIFDAVQARGFERGAHTVSICLATAALVHSGLPIESAINEAVHHLAQQFAAGATPPRPRRGKDSTQ